MYNSFSNASLLDRSGLFSKGKKYDNKDPKIMISRTNIESPGVIRIKNVNFHFVFVRSHSFHVVRK